MYVPAARQLHAITSFKLVARSEHGHEKGAPANAGHPGGGVVLLGRGRPTTMLAARVQPCTLVRMAAPTE
jgi:hypothetical protein